MTSINRLLFIISTVLLLAASAMAAPQQVGHVRIDLISETDGIRPGQPFTVGLHFVMDEHWHVYWRNPGDAGIPPKISWDLPDGFEVAPIQWPQPERFVVEPLISLGYHGELLLPVRITPPDDLPPGRTVTIAAEAQWLVCKVACIPGEAELSLELPVTGEVPNIVDEHADLFATTRDKLPLAESGWLATADLIDRDIVLTIKPPDYFDGRLDSLLFLPYDKSLINHGAKQQLTVDDSLYTLTVTRSKYSLNDPGTIDGILVSTSGFRGPGSETAIQIAAPTGEAAASSDQPTTTAAVAEDADLSIWVALAFAFLGGMILNLMPCVLPVLSLKILGFVNQSKEAGHSPLGHGLIFTAGVLLSFWILAGVMLGLQAGGEQLGWGFQLQSPAFVVVVASFMFLFGLSLLGVFEIGTSLTTVGSKTAGSSGRSGSFLNGVTATIVATPCTAPFMGSALGFSISQPPLVSMLIFTALALGMAFPYLVLSASPALLKFVPRPGPWMETLKQIMGFLLLATVIWLAWVLGIQAGPNGVVILLAVLFVLGIGAWVLGQWGTLAASTASRRVAWTVAGIAVTVALAFGLMGIERYGTAVSSVEDSSDGPVTWERYSPERVESLLANGTPVFIDFTAAWCLSCQVNKQVALRTDKVEQQMARLGVVPIQADWTGRDETITRALAEFGRNSVPLYVLYSGRGDEKPIILPEILTPGIVLDALNKIEG